MRSRYPSASTFSYSFGPGPLTPAIKGLLIANVVMFVLVALGGDTGRAIRSALGLQPVAIFTELRLWQPVTYMFLHGGLTHILFNMLSLWMFGTELERMWGTRYFLRYYFVAGIGAGLTTVAVSLLPFAIFENVYLALTIGASGAIFGVLLAYGMYFPNRPIHMYLVFPIPAKYFVMIMGAISLFLSMSGGGGGVAHVTHLGGLVAGYLYLKGGRIHLISEIKYRYLKWRINRMRRKFDVYSGGRADDVNRRVH
jgi:membrane associated rhomboid family serine protease